MAKKIGRPGRLPESVRRQRYEILERKIKEGLREPRDIARSVHHLSVFRGIRFSWLTYYIKRFIDDRKRQRGFLSGELELDTLMRPLRRAWGKRDKLIAALEEKVRQLEEEIKKLKEHKYPDPNERLIEENRLLKNRLQEYERRIEGLSKLYRHRPIGSAHTVVHGD